MGNEIPSPEQRFRNGACGIVYFIYGIIAFGQAEGTEMVYSDGWPRVGVSVWGFDHWQFVGSLVFPGLLVAGVTHVLSGFIYRNLIKPGDGNPGPYRGEVGSPDVSGYDERHESSYTRPPPPPSEALPPPLPLYLSLLANLCRVDGPVTRNEIAYLDNGFIEVMELGDRQVMAARECIRLGKAEQLHVDGACRSIRYDLGDDRRVIDDYASFLVALARADGVINRQEWEFLHAALGAFGYTYVEIINAIGEPESAKDHRQREARGHDDFHHNPGSDQRRGSEAGRGGLSLEQALKLMEVEEGFSQEALKSAYRIKVKEFHPDVLMNLTPGMRKLAEEQLKEINLAYAFLKAASR